MQGRVTDRGLWWEFRRPQEELGSTLHLPSGRRKAANQGHGCVISCFFPQGPQLCGSLSVLSESYGRPRHFISPLINIVISNRFNMIQEFVP